MQTMAREVRADGSEPPAPKRSEERRVREDLWRRGSVTLLRPSVNVCVVTVRSVNDDLDPPRELWADVAFVWNDRGVVGVLEERGDEGEDRLETRDFLLEDPKSRGLVGDDAWIRETVRRWLLADGTGT